MQNTEAYRARVEKLEALARERPEHYRLRVKALAVLGIAYRVLVTIAAFVLPIAIFLAVFPGPWTIAAVTAAMGLVLVHVFQIGTRPIRGRRLTARDAPELFKTLEALRTKLLAPPVHEVVLDHDFNAGAAQMPGRGFGWSRQILVLGVPFLAALTREQMLAVIGHELGHFSKAHGRAGHWIYRIRASWEDLYDAVGDSDSPVADAARVFYGWYVPYFGAYSFALARLYEYEADADSARATGAESAGAALAATDAYGAWLFRDFFPELWRGAREQPEAPADVCRRLADAVRTVPPEELQARFREGLKRASGLEDTHPSLAERLAALNVAGDMKLAPPAVSAGEELLGGAWDSVLVEAGESWRRAHAREWREHHKQLANDARRLEQLVRFPEPHDFELRLETARLREGLEGPKALQAQWDALRQEAPGNALLALHGAFTLAQAYPEAAMVNLDALAEREPRYAITALHHLKQIALRSGDKLRADQADTRMRGMLERRDAAIPVLSKALWRGRFEAHRMPGYAVRLLKEELEKNAAIKGAFVVSVRDPEAGASAAPCSSSASIRTR